MLLTEEETSLLFRTNGILLRILIVKEFTPLPVTVLGWRVNDISDSIKLLKSKDIYCEKSTEGAPRGTKMAWFKYPDGNILSISELE